LTNWRPSRRKGGRDFPRGRYPRWSANKGVWTGAHDFDWATAIWRRAPRKCHNANFLCDDSQSDKSGKGANTSVAWYPEFSLTYECIFSFFLSSLDDHLVGAHHFKQDEFQCKQCTVRFCHRPLLIKHEAISHN